MIIFFGGFEILAIVVIFIVITAGTAELIVNLTNFLIVIFALKNLVQTVWMGHFKRKNSLPSTVAFLAIDSARMWIFFTNLRSIGLDFVNATGLRFFSALFGFIMYFLICGGIFLLGEFLSIGQALGEKKTDKGFNKHVMLIGIITVIMLQVVTWVGYL